VFKYYLKVFKYGTEVAMCRYLTIYYLNTTFKEYLAICLSTAMRTTMHSVTDRQTDRRSDNRQMGDMMMPIADHTV